MWYALLLLLAAIAVMMIEFFVPSWGLLGILAAGLGLAAVIVGFRDGLATGALIMALGATAIPILLYGWVKIWPYTPIGKRILLDDPRQTSWLSPDPDLLRIRKLEGQLGTAHSKMLPSGQIVIDGQKYDAVSEGFAIEPGDTVIVSAIRGNRIYVEPYEGDPEDAQLPAGPRSILTQPIEDLGIDSLDDPLG